MLISEMFYSLQGEGTLVGIPSVFVRTSGCNLRCRWCDTPYASWRPEGTEMTVEQILAYVQTHPTRYVVVTGGEPMVAKGMPELLSALRAAGKHITIETAGTVLPTGIECDLASLSPKLAHSTPLPGEGDEAWRQKHEHTRWQPEVLRAWLAGPWAVQLKFVVATEQDITEVLTCLKELAPDFPREQVLLMPEGTQAAVIASRYPMLITACKEHGFRYSPRLHIDLFGNKRGT
jgi:7-carboxy-7-deazaguanine synthase